MFKCVFKNVCLLFKKLIVDQKALKVFNINIDVSLLTLNVALREVVARFKGHLLG